MFNQIELIRKNIVVDLKPPGAEGHYWTRIQNLKANTGSGFMIS